MKRFSVFVVAVLLAGCLFALAACGAVPSSKASSPAASTNPAAPASLCVTCINVGKGDCVLVQAGSATALIDAGYEETADDVLSYLESQNVEHIDAMVITHYDRDHIGGIRKIGEGVDVGIVYLPGYEGSDKNYRMCISSVEALDVPTKRVTKELSLDMEGACLTVYPSGVAYEPATDKGKEGNDNDASLVATLTNGADSYLFAGDLEEDGVDAYLAANHGRFDVLKIPHHGRYSSNTSDFIDDVCPQIAVITDAKKDSADKKVLKLLKAADVKTYRTSADGTVCVESDGSGSYAVSTSS